MRDPRDILRSRFGYDEFREGQEPIIEAAMVGRDCIGVMPTGAGKSLCYQIPALALDGVTLVISPLVSLMHDQVQALRDAGIPAAYLNSQLAAPARADVVKAALAGVAKLLYVAPERLSDPQFASAAAQMRVPLVAIDEAHCVSQWGQDFRPSYLRIAEFIASLPVRSTVAAFTATATPRVTQDIARLLGLRDPYQLTTGFDRPNLRFAVEQLPDKRKVKRLLRLIDAHPGDSGIVYCSTRKQVEALHRDLLDHGVSATRYHAGLASGERAANQRAFVNDDALVIVATNAFGMGIDKSNVRYVAHFNMPGSLEAYYQEAGRAGRDGEPSECLLMWNDGDIATCRYFVERESENEALTAEEALAVRASQRRRLSAMAGYCLTTECLRATILRYFGEGGDQRASGGTADAPATGKTGAGARDLHVAGEAGPGASPANGAAPAAPAAPAANCGNCSNCEGEVQARDVTKTARSVMRCVHEMRGRFGKGMVADILTGSKSAKIREYGLERARTYNVVEDSAGTVKEIIELLAASEYLEISEGRYPLVGLGPRAREAATDEFRLYMKRPARKRPQPASPASASSNAPSNRGAADAAAGVRVPGEAARPAARASSKTQPPANLETDEQQDLFERLRVLRKQLATDEGVPPYVVFSDAALRGMCASLPANEEEFLQVSGVGEVKLARYGEAFLREINRT